MGSAGIIVQHLNVDLDWQRLGQNEIKEIIKKNKKNTKRVNVQVT